MDTRATHRNGSTSDNEAPARSSSNRSSSGTRLTNQERPLGLGKFDIDDPQGWFDQVEMTFRIRNVTDTYRQAELILEAIPKDVWKSIKLLFQNGRPTYDDIKEELLARWEPSSAERAQQIFKYIGASPGRDNLSVAYYAIKSLATLPKTSSKPKREIDVYMELALQLFDPKITSQLPDYTTTPLKDFLTKTDEVIAAHRAAQKKATLAASQRRPMRIYSSDESDSDLEVAPLQNPRRVKSKVTVPDPPPPKQRWNRNGICYYHTRFGPKAYRCQEPCKFSNSKKLVKGRLQTVGRPHNIQRASNVLLSNNDTCTSSNNKSHDDSSSFSNHHSPEYRKQMVLEITDILRKKVNKYEHILHYNSPNVPSNNACHCLAAASCHSTFHLRCGINSINFLIDTGACKSFLPANHNTGNLLPYNGSPIITANGDKLLIHGHKKLNITIQGKTYKWKFIVANVAFPILGADFLSHKNLAVDIKGQNLIPLQNFATPLKIEDNKIPDAISKVLDKYKHLFSMDLSQRQFMEKAHSAVHHITTKGAPLHSKFRRLCPEKLKIAKEVFAEMERQGICQKAASPWSSPLHMVPKSDNTYRPCGDYRRLNNVTEPDHYPLPNIQDITNVLGGSKVFSKIDLTKGYFQVPVAKEDIPKTAITTPFGTYTFNYTCFGLKNAGATFQRLMDTILGELPFVVFYIDDLLIFSPNLKQHAEDIEAVLQVLEDNGLLARPDKCCWAMTEVEFLGHTITKNGMLPQASKVHAISNFPVPKTVKSLQQFAGMVNYYHRFIPHLADIMAPLYDALKGKPKKISWSPILQAAFERTKIALANATLLAYPVQGRELILTTDASDTAIGGVLEQSSPNGRIPIGFFSRKLSNAESKYHTLDKELLALHRSIRHFHHLLDERVFTARTDHLPLVHAFVKSKDAWSARVCRQLSEISQYKCRVTYIKGPDNTIADTLSRNSVNVLQLGIDYAKLQSAQEDSEDLKNLRENYPQLRWSSFKFGEAEIMCETSTGRPRPFIPSSLQMYIFNLVHNLSHPSGNATAKLIAERFIWKNMKKDVKSYCRACHKCQISKVGRHTESGITPFPSTKDRFANLHVDLVGPLPPSNGKRYILTIIDRATRWPACYPIASPTAESCGKAITDWISSHGLPEVITTDRGTQFTSNTWADLSKHLGFKLQFTTAYNPECNGLIERFHRSLKNALTATADDASWTSRLPWVLLGLRTAPHSALNAAPSEAVYGKNLRIPADIIISSPEAETLHDIRNNAEKLLPPKQTYSEALRKKFVPTNLQSSPFVYERIDSHKSPLTPSYTGPHPVIQRQSKAYLISKHGAQIWTSIDRLKPAYLFEDGFQPGGGPL